MSKKICFYTSVSDDLSLIKHIKLKYRYDIVCNYYGSNNDVFIELQNTTTYVERNILSKFQSLKKIYDQNLINNYDYVFVYDDDAKIYGNLNNIIDLMEKYELNIASPCHSLMGKISYDIHKYCKGKHKFRKVNFVEMNFPTFNMSTLKDFMMVYSPQVSGWGIDLWYSQLYTNIAIVDAVCIYNPKINPNSINDLYTLEERINQWDEHRKKFLALKSFPEFVPQVLEWIEN